MATIYRNPGLDAAVQAASGPEGYSGPVEIDTRIPPKARPVFNAISVNGVPVPEADILAEAQNHPARNPGEAVAAAARALVVRELLLQEARRLAMEAEPQTDVSGRRETPEDALIRALIEAQVRAPSASEAECRRFYENNPRRFSSEPIFEARHILLAAPMKDAAARKEARGHAEALITRLKKEATDFAGLARAHSACPSREQGGNLGQLTRGATVPEFEAALEEMRESEICSTPVESRFGFHIIALDRKIPGSLLPFEAVRERIAAWLEASSWSRAVAQYVAMLAGRAQIAGIDIAAAEGPLLQ